MYLEADWRMIIPAPTLNIVAKPTIATFPRILLCLYNEVATFIVFGITLSLSYNYV